MAEAVIEVRELSFAYDGGPRVLDNVRLTVHRGDYLAVLGPNGGGKTTLLKLLLGALKPTSGSVSVLGMEPGRAVSRVGYMPQDIHTRNSLPMTCLDVVLTGLRGRGFRWSARERGLALAALERVGAEELAGRLVGGLSGGQRQRVLIARALVADPEILFLDEPTASVDAQGRCSLLDLLGELNREMTIVYVSHDLSVVASGAHSVACVNRNVHFHPRPEITRDMLDVMYGAGAGACPVEVFTHGDVPHRVVPRHGAPGCCPDRENGPEDGEGGHA
ncbi:metal ABC transporter ATP-binding protein [Desulfocurvus sp. DL9XJH121]